MDDRGLSPFAGCPTFRHRSPVKPESSVVLHLYSGCKNCGHGTRAKPGLYVCPVCEVLQCRKESIKTRSAS
jgi:hypothetical protein